MNRIVFNRPMLAGRELEYVRQALDSGHISGDGPFTRRSSALLEQILGAPKVLLTTSCTHALEMAALLLDIQPGDEVITSPFTFVSTVNAFVLRGARPVFADIRRDTLNIDESALEALITPRTRAILVVHYAGVACEMDAILEIAARHRVAVVEDNAHGLFGAYKGRSLGTFGALATLSFHETKNIVCGEGGALIVNDASLVERAEIIRDKGTNRSQLFRGEVDKYTWLDVGSSYLPSDLLGAFLFGQLEERERIQRERQRLWQYYYDHLAPWSESHGARVPFVPPHCQQPWHMFYLIMSSLESRQRLISHLQSRGIQSVFHYVPLHLSRMGRRFGGRDGQCPVTEDLAERLLRLPFHRALTESDQQRIVGAVADWQ
jgi:dTDP-4-amino-4,6-dideoxygalactose transaminase